MRLTYRQQAALLGAIVGGVVGALLALLYLDHTSGEQETGPTVGWQELTQVALTLGALVRQFNQLTERES